MNIENVILPLIVSIVGAFTASYFSYRYYRPRLRADLQKEFESRFNQRKWEIYQEFANILYEVLDKSATKRFESELPKVIKKLRKFLSQLWIIGSDDVVEAVSDWFIYSNREKQSEDSPVEGLEKLMTIIIEMRKDLGYSSSQIGPRDLLRTFITDLEEAISR
jgi:hypothetical protein